MQNGVRILLMGNGPVCGDSVSTIRTKFPQISVGVTADANEAIAWLGSRAYDLVVCNAHLAAAEKMQFARRVCRISSRPEAIVVTADTDTTLVVLGTLSAATR